MNTPGDFVSDLDQIRFYLIEQVTNPIRYQKGIEAMLKAGVESFIEMGPGKTLQGMNKKMGITLPTTSIEKAAERKSLLKSKQEAAEHVNGNT